MSVYFVVVFFIDLLVAVVIWVSFELVGGTEFAKFFVVVNCNCLNLDFT